MNNKLRILGFTDEHVQNIQRMFKPHVTWKSMLLISGQSGSGKSTTVKHIAEHLLSQSPNLNIIAVEYNPEYQIKGATQIQVKSRPVYGDTIRGVADMDPDVLIVGEIRDRNTALAVIELVESGQTVITSMAAKNSNEAFERLSKLVECSAAYVQRTAKYIEMLSLGTIHQELARKNGEFSLTADVINYVPLKTDPILLANHGYPLNCSDGLKPRCNSVEANQNLRVIRGLTAAECGLDDSALAGYELEY